MHRQRFDNEGDIVFIVFDGRCAWNNESTSFYYDTYNICVCVCACDSFWCSIFSRSHLELTQLIVE